MATIKVFSSAGVKELRCFDTLSDVPFLPIEEDDLPEEDLPVSDEDFEDTP